MITVCHGAAAVDAYVPCDITFIERCCPLCDRLRAAHRPSTSIPLFTRRQSASPACTVPSRLTTVKQVMPVLTAPTRTRDAASRRPRSQSVCPSRCGHRAVDAAASATAASGRRPSPTTATVMVIRAAVAVAGVVVRARAALRGRDWTALLLTARSRLRARVRCSGMLFFLWVSAVCVCSTVSQLGVVVFCGVLCSRRGGHG